MFPLSVLVLLVVAAFVTCIANAMGKCPGWVPDILVIVTLLLLILPKG